MYKYNELIIICKLCGKEKKVCSKRELHRVGIVIIEKAIKYD